MVLGVGPGDASTSFGSQMIAWGGVVGLYALLQLPFDIWGGYVLPHRYGRATGSPTEWGFRWTRGVVLHSGVMLLAGWSALFVGRIAGDWAVVGALALASGVLVAGQGRMAEFLLGAASTSASADRSLAEIVTASGLESDRVHVVDAAERGFVGGWVGPRGLERLLIPSRWLEDLEVGELTLWLTRRRIALRSGLRAGGVIGALAFNSVGMVLVLGLLPGAHYQDVSGLVIATAAFTLWSFVGLLSLPTLSRWAVHRLDDATARQTGHSQRLIDLIRQFDRDQEDELTRSAWTEAVFHPVPSPQSRASVLMEHTRMPASPFWRIARMALFTSWAQASWLSRAVHCNIGRPGLWAVFPGD